MTAICCQNMAHSTPLWHTSQPYVISYAVLKYTEVCRPSSAVSCRAVLSMHSSHTPDIFACIENEWSELCTHPCKEAPQLNHGSFSGKCSGADVGKNTVCPGHCDQGWTLGQQQPTARCTSAGWVVKGSCKVRMVTSSCVTHGLGGRVHGEMSGYFQWHWRRGAKETRGFDAPCNRR
jgi:hypothetical protein